MKHIFLLIIFTSLITLFSCDNPNISCMKNTGEIVTVKNNLDIFNTIVINGNFDIKLKQSSDYSISITAGKNIIPFIKYGVVGRSLNLSDENKCNWLRDYSKIILEISFPYINEIQINEACNIFSIDTLISNKLIIDNRAGILKSDFLINCDTIEFRAHASTGDYRFSGKTEYAYIYNIGNGYIYAHNLKTKSMHIVHKSFGKSILNVTENLKIEEIKYGNVELRFGCPAILFESEEYKKFFISNPICP